MDTIRPGELNRIGGQYPVPGPPMLPYGDEAKEKAPAQTFSTLPDGRMVFDNIDPNGPLNMSLHYPGQDMLDEERERAKGGFKIKPTEKQLTLGPLKEPLVDATVWTKEPNEYISSISDILPKIPFIWIFIGGIGSGKTNFIANIVKIYNDEKCFKTIHVFSPTAHLDPTLATVQYERKPDTKVELHTRFDVRIIQEKNAEIQALYAPYRQKAKIGKYEHREDRAKLASMLREFDDPSHPYLNSWGVSHGRKPFVPVRRSMFGKVSREPIVGPAAGLRDQSVRATIQVMRTRQGLPLETHNVLDAMMSATLPEHRQNVPRTLNGDVSEFAKEINLTHENVVNLQNQRVLHERYLMDPSLHAGRDIKPTLLIFDDATGTFQGAFGSFLKKFITTIRHTRMSIVIVVHKLSAVPTVIRAVTTHVTLANTKNKREIELLDEEFGSKFPDFPGLLNAATVPQPGRPKDFLMLDLEKGKAYRSFSGELVNASDFEEAAGPASAVEVRPIPSSTSQEQQNRKRKRKDKDKV